MFYLRLFLITLMLILMTLFFYQRHRTVVILLVKSYQKLPKRLSKELERSVWWKEYKTKNGEKQNR